MPEHKILILDDDERITTLCVHILGHHGYDVQTANNRTEFNNLIEKEKFDLLISDLRLPDMSGLDGIRQALLADPRIGIIMMTGAVDLTEDEKKEMKRLCYRVLFKPLGPKDIEEAVDTFFKGRSL